MGEMEVHRNALFEDEALTVDCFAYNTKEGILAVGRHIDTEEKEMVEWFIELWNGIAEPVFYMKTIPLGNNGGAQSLLWANDTDSLLVAHINGSITIHHTHSPQFQVIQICATPIWCIAPIKSNSFCVGTDSGAVFLLDYTADNQLNVIKTVNIGFGSRVLSLASDGTIIAVGSLDTIHIVNAQNASIRHCLRLARDEKRKPTIVWSIVFMQSTLISGDSRGCICFWNPLDGTLVQTIQTHQSDILALCAVRNTLCASGVDPSLAYLNFNKGRNLWRVERRRQLHNNDVRALVASRTALFSGGAQHHFIASCRNRHYNARKLTPCKVAPLANIFYYEYTNRIVIWRIARAERIAADKRYFALKQQPQKLAEIRLSPNEYITSSAITADGNFLAISTRQKVVVYSLSDVIDEQDATITTPTSTTTTNKQIHRIAHLEQYSTTSLLFSSSSSSSPSSTLIIASHNFTINIIIIDNNNNSNNCVSSSLQEILQQDNGGEIIRLHANYDGTKIVAITTRNDIFVVDLLTKSLQKLEMNLKAIVVMDAQFINDTTVMILCADYERTLLEYSLKENSLSGKTMSTSSLSMTTNETVMDMEANPHGIILVGSNGTIRIIDIQQRIRTLLLMEDKSGMEQQHEEHQQQQQQQQRHDRCFAARWLYAAAPRQQRQQRQQRQRQQRLLLLSTPVQLNHPSLGAFKAKRYGQN